MTKWQPIETAPKGGGAGLVTDPLWVEPPEILAAFPDGEVAVIYWDWAYAEGGRFHQRGLSAWLLLGTGESVTLHFDEPTHWMPLPDPPEVQQ